MRKNKRSADLLSEPIRKRFPRFVSVLAGACLLAVPALAAGPTPTPAGTPSAAMPTTPPPPLPTKPRQIDAAPIAEVEAKGRACWSLIEQDPDEALRFAQAWSASPGREPGGGVGGLRCAAQALTVLGRPAEAGRLLESVAVALAGRSPPGQAAALRDAGRSWLVAGDQPRALSAFDRAVTALVDGGDTSGIILDRAMAKAAGRDYQGALDDLNAVLAQIGDDREVVMVRARIYRQVGWQDLAIEDLNAWLKKSEFDAEALVERGLLKQQRQDLPGALADWRVVQKMVPGTVAGRQAAKLADDLVASHQAMTTPEKIAGAGSGRKP